jgi:hypothetical protein
MDITRDNIDSLVDGGKVQVAMRNGNWWTIRRNGATKRWKRDATRINLPYKAGMYVYGAITDSDFNRDTGVMTTPYLRLAP